MKKNSSQSDKEHGKAGIMKQRPAYVAQRKCIKGFRTKNITDICVSNMIVLSPQHAEYKNAEDAVKDR